MTGGFPVLHYGPVLHVDQDQWRFRLHGLVAKEQELTWEGFQALPRAKVECDIHCVTHWSKLGTHWEGVLGKTVVTLARTDAAARFAIAQGYGGFDTNLRLSECALLTVIATSLYSALVI